ncbi:hypothetical protein H6P81_003224 [Aristolochia fimbriata]|uniref:Uncharacterized protein n=1 Tax=Aristolochia fimbriata TaxID=158543 RepID=A0AAV7FFV5_ARIFI|nr:hypothetical protein H6P81_003224 [Aristolochia fimbriata]
MSKFDQHNSAAGSHYFGLPVEEHCSIQREGMVDTLFISAKALNIVWGNDRRYWKWTPLEDQQGYSKFRIGAELLQVNWIQVTGKLDTGKITKFFHPSRDQVPKTYEIFWVMKFNVDAFGWHNVPIKFKVATDGSQPAQRIENLGVYRKRNNIQWHEIRGGVFTVGHGSKSGNVYFGMFETESVWWKGSMVLAGLKIKPK